MQVGPTRTVLMPRRPGLHRRALVTAEVTVRGGTLVLAGSHLDLEATARLDTARRIRTALPRGPLVFGADVNEQPGRPAWQVLAEGLHGGSPGATFPAHAPRRRIDLVLTSLPLVRLEVVDTGAASDHLAVLAEVALP